MLAISRAHSRSCIRMTWPNAWEGGWVKGRDGVRHYWQRQWAALDPHVDPAPSAGTLRDTSRSACIRSCATWQGSALNKYLCFRT
jgi:hypothetical protein